MSEWISVEDQLPKDDDIVVASYAGAYQYRLVTYWSDYGGRPHFGVPDERDGLGSQPATHWTPLPEPPQ